MCAVVYVSRNQWDELMKAEADEPPAELRRLVLAARKPNLTRLFSEPSVFERDDV